MRVRVPGDKSLTQRALLLSVLAEGGSRISGLLHGGDAASTAAALRQLGAHIPEIPADGSEVRIEGLGLTGLREPEAVLDLRNSGTGARLLLGALAGNRITATVDGDASLRARPMARVTDPLVAMGARIDFEEEEGRLPITVQGSGRLQPIDWPSPVASAQVKSAILLAGLTGGSFALITEPRQSRDHTERMLNGLGASVVSHAVEGGWRVELRDPPDRIASLDFHVPGDPSSAAFVLGMAALGGADGPVTVEGVCINPTRTAFLDVLRRMNVVVDVEEEEGVAGGSLEPIGDITAGPSDLRATSVGEEEIPWLIDELPMIAVLAARADGTTRITGAAELRTKESDRITALVANLRRLGVKVEELADGLVVEGTDRTLRGRVQTFADHRIAMAFQVLGATGGTDIEVVGAPVFGVSFPGFQEMLHRLAVGGHR